MPETRGERVAFCVGLIVVAALIAAIALRPRFSHPANASTHTQTTRTTNGGSTSTTDRAATTTSEEAPGGSSVPAATTTTTAVVTAPPTGSAGIRLSLQARADTWVSVRQNTRSGRILFEGTMAADDSRTFTGTQFSVRFGAAANMAATLDGKPLPLPSGTYSVSIDRDGLGSRSA